MSTIIEFKEVYKTYKQGDVEVNALKNASFQIAEGEFVIIFGPSGAGKSTILNILGGIDRASSGTVMVDGEDITNFNEKKLNRYRSEKIGFVFQFYNLIANLTAMENVALASGEIKYGYNPVEILDKVGLGDKINSFPSQLSGGQQQRVAIARALVKKPKFLLCDEPTGSLDSEAGAKIFNLLKEINKRDKCSIVVITHNPDLLPMANKVIKVQNGAISKIEVSDDAKNLKEVNLA
jgi:putative ABC transport system ATP-binding protein